MIATFIGYQRRSAIMPIRHLIEPEQLQKLQEQGQLLLAQVTSPAVYAQGHLPGAVHVPPQALIAGTAPAPGKLPSLPQLEALFGSIGYTPEHLVVVYDDEGGGWAGRLAWTLDVIGHHRWCYLNGGLHAWVAAGLALTQETPVITPTKPVLQLDPAPIADAPDVLQALDDPDCRIWDVRSADEYAGRRVAAARGGHIPGAVHLDWLDLMDRSRALRLREDVAELLGSHGLTPDKRLITHCQTHHRSGLSYMTARILGFPKVKAYHGSWSEWGNDPALPVVSGDNPR